MVCKEAEIKKDVGEIFRALSKIGCLAVGFVGIFLVLLMKCSVGRLGRGTLF